jgi:hypothetical protein
VLGVAAQEAVPNQGPRHPAERARRKLRPEQHATETSFVSDEARWAERRCQGPVDLSAPKTPVKASSKQRRIVTVGDATNWEVSSAGKPTNLRLKGGFQQEPGSIRLAIGTEVKQLKAQIRELERLLGRKTQEAEILKEAVEIIRKKLVSPYRLPKKDDFR